MALNRTGTGKRINIIEASAQPDAFQLIWFKDGFIRFRIIGTFRIFPAGPSGFPFIVCEFGSVEVFYSTQTGIESVIGIPRDTGLPGLSPLSSDQHDAVSTSRSINGCCRSIFQYLHRSDVLGIKVRQPTYYWDVVDNIQGIIARIKRASAPDPYLWSGSGLTSSLCHIHAGGPSLEGLSGICDGQFVDFPRTHGGNGAGKLALFHRSIAHHNHFVQIRKIQLERYVNHRAI